jgi:SAM-dependent methyltransferase
MDAFASMRAAWNERAKADARHYIETDHWDGDNDKFFALGEEIVHKIADPYLPPQRGLALDIGCGVGRLTRALSHRFDKAVGLDVSDEMIAQGAALQKGFPKVQLLATDGVAFPVQTASVDFVFSYVVFQHMPTREVIAGNLKEAARVLKPGGSVLLHMKHRYKSPAHAIWQNIPSWLINPIKKLRGVDPLKMSASYRGVGPLSTGDLNALFGDAGLTIRKTFDDQTHTPTHEYVWVHATR